MSRETATIPVLWTNDDIHFGRAAELKRHLDFLDELEIPGVFFVIPRSGGGDLDQDVDLMRLIESARGRGHEFYQHGFLHFAFECGVPDLGMFSLDPAAHREFDVRRAEVEALHTFEAQVGMLDNGRRIWRRAFGDDPVGFRPGWGAFCTNFYRALAALGYQWVSSRLPCMTSWLRNAGKWDAPIDFRDEISTAPHLLEEGIWEFPIAGDYGFTVPNEPARIDAMVDLGLAEFAVYAGRGHPMLVVSHPQGLERSGTGDGTLPPHPRGTGYAVHSKLFPALRATGRVRFLKMSDLVRETIAA